MTRKTTASVGRPATEQPPDAPAFAVAVRAARQARGWTQEDLARAADTSQRQIARIEAGQEPLLYTAADVARALGSDVTTMIQQQ